MNKIETVTLAATKTETRTIKFGDCEIVLEIGAAGQDLRSVTVDVHTTGEKSQRLFTFNADDDYVPFPGLNDERGKALLRKFSYLFNCVFDAGTGRETDAGCPEQPQRELTKALTKAAAGFRCQEDFSDWLCANDCDHIEHYLHDEDEAV